MPRFLCLGVGLLLIGLAVFACQPDPDEAPSSAYRDAGTTCWPGECGGACGTCAAGLVCTAERRCCEPLCSGRVCGADGCGRWCGSCDAPMTCVAGECVRRPPDDPCGEGQWLDRTQTPPVCVAICNPPHGCKEFETCNEQTAVCEPLSCGADKCEFGQRCADPTTREAAEVCSCLPRPENATGAADEDSCAPYGKVCDFDPANPAPSTCRPPGDREPCVAAMGCSGEFTCRNIGEQSLCVRKCQSISQCPIPSDWCVPNSPESPAFSRMTCLENVCADPSRDPAERSRYFRPCAAASASDGMCLPFRNVRGWPEVGLCVQGGSAPPLGACNPLATRGELTSLCPAGEICAPAASGATVGQCRAMCNAAPQPSVGTPACDGQETCVDVSGAPDGEMTTARLGRCEPR